MCENATMPPMPRNATIMRTRNRWWSANWTMRLIMRTISSALERVGKLEKQAAVPHNFVSGGKTFRDLRHPVLTWPGFDIASAELVGADGNIDKGLVVVVVQHGRVRHGNRVGDLACRHRHRAVHIAFQLFARIVHNN